MSTPALAGKTGLVVGVANKRSLSWAIAQAAAAEGASLVLTYQGERLEENVRELGAHLRVKSRSRISPSFISTSCDGVPSFSLQTLIW
jgi:enoyl-[acyl-carrier-protein] reductase (NADH)